MFVNILLKISASILIEVFDLQSCLFSFPFVSLSELGTGAMLASWKGTDTFLSFQLHGKAWQVLILVIL